MPYIAPEIIMEAKRMDLLTYLKNYEPHVPDLFRLRPDVLPVQEDLPGGGL